MSSKTWRDINRSTGGYSPTTNAGNSQSHPYNKRPTANENSTLLKAASNKPSVGGHHSDPQFPGRRKDDHPLSNNINDRALTSPAFAGDYEAAITDVSLRDSGDAANGKCGQSHDEKETKGKNARFSDLPRSSKYILILLTMAHTLHMMSYSLIGPFYTQEALKKGTSQGQVGLIFSIFAIVVFISTPIFGANIAVIGPQFLLFSGILTSGTSCILFGVLEYCPGGVTFTAMSYLVRGFDGLGVSAYTVGAYSIAFSACPDHVTFVAGILQSAVTIGMCVGPVMGSVLFEAGGFGLPFYSVGVVILINGIMVYFSVSGKIVTNRTRSSSISRFSLLRNPLAWLAFATSGLFTGTLGSLSANLAVYVSTTMGSSQLIIGIMFALWPLVYAINSPLLGWLCKREGIERFLNPISIFFVGLGFALLGPNPIFPFLPSSEWIVFVGLAVLGCAYAGCSLSSVKLYFVSAMEKGMEDNLDTFGMISSLLNSGCSFGAFWGAAASGFITANLGFPSTVAITSSIAWIVMLISIILFLLRRRKKVLEERSHLLSSVDTGKDSGGGVEETSLAAKNENITTTLRP